MEEISIPLVVVSGIKSVLAMLVSSSCIYFGYRLFYLTESNSTEMEMSGKWGKIKLVKAAPGIFFSLFGCAVLIFALDQHASTSDYYSRSSPGSDDGHQTNGQSRKVDYGVAGSQERDQFDYKSCASSLHSTIEQIHSSQEYISAEKDKKDKIDEMINNDENVVAACVDKALGQGKYRVFKSVDRDYREHVGTTRSKEDNDAYREVLEYLSG